MMEAYTKLDRYKNAHECLTQSQELSKSYKRTDVRAAYFRKTELAKDKMEMDNILDYQNSGFVMPRNKTKCSRARKNKRSGKAC